MVFIIQHFFKGNPTLADDCRPPALCGRREREAVRRIPTWLFSLVLFAVWRQGGLFLFIFNNRY